MSIFKVFQKRALKARADDAMCTFDGAWKYLWEQFWSNASTRDRDFLIAPQLDALNLLNEARLAVLIQSLEAR